MACMQRRACKANCCLILFPVLVCGLLGGLQTFMDNLFKNLGGDKPDCKGCDGRTGGGGVRLREDAVGGLSCSPSCPLPVAQRWPVVLLLPGSKGDALNFSALMEMDNKPPPCVSPESCTAPAKFLVTGGNKSFAQSTYVYISSAVQALLVQNSLGLVRLRWNGPSNHSS